MTDAEFDAIVNNFLRARRAEHYDWLQENAPRCRHSHVLNSKNLHVKGGYRRCRFCERVRWLERKERGHGMPRVSTAPIIERVRFLERRGLSLSEIARTYDVNLRSLMRLLTRATLRFYEADDFATRLRMEHASTLWPEVAC